MNHKMSIVVNTVFAIVLAVGFLGAQHTSAGATGRCYVNGPFPGSPETGDSWLHAFGSLQTALGDTGCTEIWVATGRYVPGTTSGSAFSVPSGTAVYGGFAGTENSTDARDLLSYNTILSGDINLDDSDPNGNLITDDTSQIVGTNANHVVLLSAASGGNVTDTTILDGLVITAGYATDGGGGLSCNGGNVHECSPKISNVRFVGNYSDTSGGAVYLFGNGGGISSPKFTNVNFSYNTAHVSGGALYSDAYYGTSNPQFDHVEFGYNHADQNGGAFASSAVAGTSSPVFSNVTFDHNDASWSGGAVFNGGDAGLTIPTFTDTIFTYNSASNGGAVYNNGSSAGRSDPAFSRVEFSSNTSAQSGGAVYNVGNASGQSNPAFTDVTFFFNHADNWGGAVYNDGWTGQSSPSFLNVTFDNNRGAYGGGAVYNDGYLGISSPTFTNVTFNSNYTTATGSNGSGGAVVNWGSSGTSSPIFTNVTFNGNHSTNHAGAILNMSAAPTLRNTVVWGDWADTANNEIENQASTTNIDFSIVAGGCDLITGNSCGSNNQTGNPNLGALASNGGFTKTIAVQPVSSAIDTGDNTSCAASPVNNLDQRGRIRPLDGDGNDTAICDIGAYEYVPPHTFADVPVLGKEWMEPWITAFYAAGITTGCNSGPLRYCPENQVTRAEMAVFLLRAKHGASYAPPAASHYFSDMPVPGKEWMEPWIDQYYREGLTTGCGADPLRFCPANNVTRGEMAVFVLRATHTTGWAPPASTGIFADVPVGGKEWMQPWIEEYYHAGITTGCNSGPLRYCPENTTTRAEMAVFIDRAFGFYTP